MSKYDNSVLQRLSRSDLKLIEGSLASQILAHGKTIAEAGDPIEHVFFPNSGLISLVVPLSAGEMIEAGVVGREDVLGASAAFGARTHLNTAVVQMPGAAAVIKASDLIEAAGKSETLRRDLFLHDQFVLAQAQQSAACNARHNIPERLATWLLRIRDRAQQDELPLTQEFLSQMIGVQRASVSIAASAMQNAGLIHYRRGRIQITDVPGLEATACECYASLRGQFRRMTKAAEPRETATAAEGRGPPRDLN